MTCLGLSLPAQAQNAGTLGDLVNNTLQQQPAGDMLENAVSAAVTDQVLNRVQDVLDNVDGAAEIEAAAAQISAILDIAEGDAANLVQDALNGDLIGGSLESALNDMLTETVATGIEELLGGAASGDLMNIVSGLLNGLNGAATDPVALLAALNALGISLESLGLTEEHLNALLGLSLPLCSSGAWGDTCTGDSMAVSSGNVINVPAGGNIQAAVQSAKPGDTVVVACGTYNKGFNIARSGTADGWITIKSAEPHCAKINGKVTLYQSDYIRIEGFALSNGGISATAGHHLEIVKNDITRGTIFMGLSDFLLIDGNTVHGDDGNGSFNQIEVLWPVNITGDTTTQNRIVVRNNVSYDNRRPGGTDASGIIIDKFIRSSDPKKIGVDYKGYYQHTRGPLTDYTFGGIVDNNIFYNNNGAGIYVNFADNITVSNNISYDNQQRNIAKGEKNPWAGNITNINSSNNVFTNNVAITKDSKTYAFACQDFKTDKATPSTNNTWSGNTTCDLSNPGAQSVSTKSNCPVDPSANNLGDCSIAERLGLTGGGTPSDYLVSCGNEGETGEDIVAETDASN